MHRGDSVVPGIARDMARRTVKPGKNAIVGTGAPGGRRLALTDKSTMRWSFPRFLCRARSTYTGRSVNKAGD